MKAKLKITPQRDAIMAELRRTGKHPSAEEIYLQVRKKLPRISLTTVHRNLEILSQNGLINKYEFSGRIKRYDWDVEPHDHIYCVKCQRIDNIVLDEQQRISTPSEHDSGYQIAGCHYFGVCPKCRKKSLQK